jgi:hypothetical protein
LPMNSHLLPMLGFRLLGTVVGIDAGQVKVKVKFTLEQATKAQSGSRGTALPLSLTSALDGVGGQRYAPATLRPGKTRYPLYRRLGGPQGRSERVWKISLPPPPPTGFDPRTFQPVATLYRPSYSDPSCLLTYSMEQSPS